MTVKKLLAACSLAPDIDSSSLRARIYAALFTLNPRDRTARAVEWTVAILILVNIVSLILESIPSVRVRMGSSLRAVEIATLSLFSVEYLLRLWSVTAACDYRRPIRGRLKYAISFFALVDFVSVLPLFVGLIGADVKVVAAARMLRLLKFARYSMAMQSLLAVFVSKRNEIAAAMLILVSLLLLASFGIYLAESDVQPESFGSIPESLWWSVVTVTTVGYGDATPITPLGKLFTGVIALLGLLVITIPTGIISAGFIDEFRRRSSPARCPRCGEPANN